MLVVFGANGRSGVELVRAALARGLEVRGVCRDNRDQAKLAPFLHYQSIYHADPDRPQTLAVAVKGARTVVCCLDRRTTGVDGSEFGYTAAEAVFAAAKAAGVPQRIHMSVIGASRMALGNLERQAGFMDFGAKKAGAALFRVSCYHDEVAAAPLPPRGRYAPLSRAEAAAILLDWLPRYRDGAELRVGGPEVYSGSELGGLLKGKRAAPYTGFPGLPAGDLSVTPATTLEQTGTLPVDRLGDWLLRPPPAPPTRPPPAPLPSWPVLQAMGPNCRREFFAQLELDRERLKLPQGALDLSVSTPTLHREQSRDGALYSLDRVQIRGEDGKILHEGGVDYFYDDPSRQVFYWWTGAGLPRRVWEHLDVVARKKLRQDDYFREDPALKTFG